MTLEVLVCTFDGGIDKVADVLLPPMADVRYLISFQYSDDSYKHRLSSLQFNRKDVRVISVRGRGLSANRNHAVANAVGDILLLADDDVRYKEIYFRRILECFITNPQLDIACFQAETLDGNPFKPYAATSFSYSNQPHGTWFSSVEIAFRRKAACPRFDERFGLGAPFLCAGEEEVFLLQAFRNGLDIHYYPEVVVRTESHTTGRRFFASPAMQRTKGAVLCLIHGPFGAWIRCLKFSLRHIRQSNPLRTLYEMTRGILYVKP